MCGSLYLLPLCSNHVAWTSTGFMYAAIGSASSDVHQLCLEDTVALKSFISSRYYNLLVFYSTYIDHCTLRRELWWRYSLRTEWLNSFTFFLLSSCMLSMQEETSLMRAELCTEHGYSSMSLGVILLLCSFSRIIVFKCFWNNQLLTSCI